MNRLVLLCLPGLLLSAEPEAGPRPAGWELQLRDGGVVESPFLRSREDELWLDAEGERRVPVAELLRAEFRPERERLAVPELPARIESEGKEQVRMTIPLPMEKAQRLRFRISQENAAGWSLAARRVTRNAQGTSERTELSIRQSGEGLDIRDLGTRQSHRVRGEAPPDGVFVSYELLMNWDPPSFAVLREGQPIFVSELPGMEGRDRRRELVLIIPEGVKTTVSDVELSLADGTLPERRRAQADPAPPDAGKIRVFLANQDHIDVEGLVWEEESISLRLAPEGPTIRMPAGRVAMVLYP